MSYMPALGENFCAASARVGFSYGCFVLEGFIRGGFCEFRISAGQFLNFYFIVSRFLDHDGF